MSAIEKLEEMLDELSSNSIFDQENFEVRSELFYRLAEAFRDQTGEADNGVTDEEIEELAEQAENLEMPNKPVEGWEFVLGADVAQAVRRIEIYDRLKK